jgi:hypothetical protein
MMSSALFESEAGGAGRVTLEELVRAKRLGPLQAVEELMEPGVFGSDDEVDEFIASVREWRRSDLG